MTLKEFVLIRSFVRSYLAVASVCITQSTILYPKPWSIQTSILIEINIILPYNHSHPRSLNLHSKSKVFYSYLLPLMKLSVK